MPELPEVEVTRLSLVTRLEGASVIAARLGKPLRWPLGVATDHLAGRQLGALQRRGKYLWLPLDTLGIPDRLAASHVRQQAAAADPVPPPAGGLLLHLGMSGSLNLADNPPPPGVHDHFDLQTSRGTLRLTDPRRFGAVVWSPSLQADPAAKLLARLGAEPFDPALTPLSFHAALHARRTSIKAALLAGDILVGAGNIYVAEALFRSGIDPRARCNTLSKPRCERLLAALRETLARAISLGGSTLRDFRDAHGMSGAFQDEAQVYGRAHQPCPRCGGPIRRIVQAQRSSFFCPACQRR